MEAELVRDLQPPLSALDGEIVIERDEDGADESDPILPSPSYDPHMSAEPGPRQASTKSGTKPPASRSQSVWGFWHRWVLPYDRGY
jgi:hypothetical protein